mmetsp:Transcript_22341/g.25886  ORF Transcript_22341/g.25886 Transcript_22341/m.25886 type:complete len:515 (+) Transcript_22341:189-1733(+)
MFDAIFRLVLSPEDLYQKRKSSQIDQLKHALQDTFSASERNVRSKSTVLEKINDDSTLLDSIVNDVLDKSKITPDILGVRTDDNKMNPILVIAVQNSGNNSKEGSSGYEKVLELPLVPFGMKLADAFEQQLTSTALCFIADASSGLGSDILGSIVESCGAGLVLIKDPAWMTMLASLADQKKISQANLNKLLFGLCRMNAWKMRDAVGEDRTIVFTLPGQSCTANLLPSLQKVFPCERHVFVYDGCIDSTARGLRNLRIKKNTMNDTLPLSMPRTISASIPITSLKDVAKLETLLVPLSNDEAGIVESWLISVDAFLKLKHNERKTGYTPFVCRLGFLMSLVGRLGNGSVDQSQLALTNVMQYITGSRSRSLKDGVLEEAKKILIKIREKDLMETKKYENNVSDSAKEAIEACVFAHKGILIENKTLMDTVQPKADWSLKAAKKLTSCACCMPGEGDEEDEEEDDENEEKEGDKSDTKISGTDSKLKNVTTSINYVDGKAGFAFDPSKFTGMTM